MRILLIEPPFHRFMGFYRYFFPYGLSSLATYLDKEKHEVAIYDADHGDKPISMTSSDLLRVFPKYPEGIRNVGHPLWKEMENVIRSFGPDIVGITFMSTKLGSVKNTVRIIKDISLHIPVVLGGAHPSELYQSSLTETGADFVVLGEGEATFAELVDALQAGRQDVSGINGLAFPAANGKVLTTTPRSLIKDLDELPFPDRESLMKLETYRPDDLSMIMTSRGCPFNCSFCSSIWERKVRNRSVANIVAEVEYLVRRFGTKNIFFKDDTFTLNRRRVLDFCASLQAGKTDVNWECLTRIELVDEEIVLRMREAGLSYLKIGIETGSPRLLKATNKNLTLDQVKRGAEVLNRLNQKWAAFFMVGFPDETGEEIRMTWDLIKEIRPTYVSMSILVPYPGCQYYYDLEKIGAVGEFSDWNLFDPFSLETHFTQNISRERFQELAVETMRIVDEYNFRFGRHPGAQDEKE